MEKLITFLFWLFYINICFGQETEKIESNSSQKEIVVKTNEKSGIQFGTYGIYLDYSTYTELKINENQTFEYIERGFTGIGYRNYGKWKIQKRKLILYDYVENNSLSPMPTTWKIKNNELCNITNKSKQKGNCISIKK